MRIKTNFWQLPGVSNLYRGRVRTCLIPKTRCVSSSSCSRISTRLTTSRGGCCAAPRTRKTLRKKPSCARTNSFPALMGETRALGFSRLRNSGTPRWGRLRGGGKWNAALNLEHPPCGSTIQMLVQYFGQSRFDVDGSISASRYTSLLNQSPRSASLETLLV